MRKGEVWWAKLPRPVGRRPVVLISRDEAYAVRSLVTVAPVTTTIREIPVEVRLGRDEGLPRACVANADTIVTIPRKALAGYIGVLSPAKAAALDDAIRYALSLD